MWFAAVNLMVMFAVADAARLQRRNPPIFDPEVDNVGGMRVLYAAPPGARVPKPSVLGMPPAFPNGLKGVALLFHACGRNSADWFQLPEESQMVQKLFERGFAVVAPSEAPGSPGGCWVPAVDTIPVNTAMKLFLTSRGLDKLPLYGIGLSSGGEMAAALQFAGLKFAGLHLNSSPGGAKKNNPGFFAGKGFPPTSFVHFPADTYAAPDDIRTAEAALTRNHVPVQILQLQPKPITELAARVEAAGLGPNTGMKLVHQLEKWNLVENRYGQNFMVMMSSDQALTRLIADPDWFPLMKTKNKMVLEELHLVEGVHGTSVEHFDLSLDFLLDPTHNPALHEPPASSEKVATSPVAEMAIASVQQMPDAAIAPAKPPAMPHGAPFLAAASKGAGPASQTSTQAQAIGGITCSKWATGHPDKSNSQRILMLSPKALSTLEAHDVELSAKVSYLCTCLKVRIDARPASQTHEAALMLLGGETLPLPDEGRTADSPAPDIDLKAAKAILCHGEAESECKQCASSDPFGQPKQHQ